MCSDGLFGVLKAPSIGTIVTRTLSLSAEQPACGHEPLDSDGASSMNPSRADSDFGAESEAIPVGEAGRCIVKDACGVHLSEKSLRDDGVLGADGLGMAAAVAMNEVDGLIEAVHSSDRQDAVAILCAAIRVGCGDGAWKVRSAPDVGPELDPGRHQGGAHTGQLRQECRVNQ